MIPLFKRGFFLAVLCFAVSVCRAETSPFDITFFGIYGAPVYPPALAVPISEGFGFNFLAEWNATSYTSMGLGFEQVAFHGSPTVQMVNFEGRLFPMENEKGSFAPYLYGGAGLNLATGPWEGPVQLKMGIGSRITLAGPLHFDVAVGSHWLQPPSDFQYVDVRYGLSLSFGFKEKPAAEKAAPVVPPPTATAQASPIATAAIPFTPTPTTVVLETKTAPTTIDMASEPETIVVDSAPVTSAAQAKQYYNMGMDAFGRNEYKSSMAFLKKSLWIRERHKAPYFYAETYATLGVIYQFHSTEKNHKKTALNYYEKARKIDPTTRIIKRYYKKLKGELAVKSKPKKKKRRPPKHHKVGSVSTVAPSSPVTN